MTGDHAPWYGVGWARSMVAWHEELQWAAAKAIAPDVLKSNEAAVHTDQLWGGAAAPSEQPWQQWPTSEERQRAERARAPAPGQPAVPPDCVITLGTQGGTVDPPEQSVNWWSPHVPQWRTLGGQAPPLLPAR